MKNYKTKFEKESNIKIVAQYFLDILLITDNFNKITENPSFDVFSTLELRKTLKDTKFSPKLGSSYPVCLAFVVDAYLKRGNIFRSSVTQRDLIRLVSFASERDIFIKHYESNLFLRLATRATIGHEKERQFLNSVAAVVQLENLRLATDILEEAVEQIEFGIPDFQYILVKKSRIQDLPKEIGLMCPQPYIQRAQKCTEIFSSRWRERKVIWSHTLATCEGKLKTKKGVSSLFMSLVQATIFFFITQNGNKETFENLQSLTKLDHKKLLKILTNLVKTKILICDVKKSQYEQGTFSVNNNFHTPKGIIADNWKHEETKVKEVKKDRSLAIQALGVKLMKKNKIMKVQQLKEEIAREASFLFPASPSDIAQALRVLEINGYIEYSDSTHIIYKE